MKGLNLIIEKKLKEVQQIIAQKKVVFSTLSKNFTFEKNDDGSLQFFRGAISVVFKAKDKNNNEYAVKALCLNKEELASKYASIEQYNKRQENSCFPKLTYLKNELQLLKSDDSEESCDVIVTPWVMGVPLYQYLGKLTEEKNITGIKHLYYSFVQMAKKISQTNVVHRNITDANVIVDANGNCELIDFDEAYIAEMNQWPVSEYCNRNYKHPNYKQFEYSEYFDEFSILVLATTIFATSIDTNLFGAYKNDRSLLFTMKDFENPKASPTFEYLYGLKNEFLDCLLYKLEIAALTQEAHIPNMHELLVLNSANVKELKTFLEKKLLQASYELKEEAVLVLNNQFQKLVINSTNKELENENLVSTVNLIAQENNVLKATKAKVTSFFMVAVIAIVSLLGLSLYKKVSKNTIEKQPLLLVQNTIPKMTAKAPTVEVKNVIVPSAPTPTVIAVKENPVSVKQVAPIQKQTIVIKEVVKEKSSNFNVVFKDIEFNNETKSKSKRP
jgi:serine/threonine protein kinase